MGKEEKIKENKVRKIRDIMGKEWKIREKKRKENEVIGRKKKE